MGRAALGQQTRLGGVRGSLKRGGARAWGPAGPGRMQLAGDRVPSREGTGGNDLSALYPSILSPAVIGASSGLSAASCQPAGQLWGPEQDGGSTWRGEPEKNTRTEELCQGGVL